jgi:DNA-binding NarL/FixJ family response regulator
VGRIAAKRMAPSAARLTIAATARRLVTNPCASANSGRACGKIEDGSLRPRIAPTGDAQTLAKRIAELGDRDREILMRIAQGQSDYEIAEETWVPLKTIRIERRRLIRHLRDRPRGVVRGGEALREGAGEDAHPPRRKLFRPPASLRWRSPEPRRRST